MDRRFVIAAVVLGLALLALVMFIYQPAKRFGANPPEPTPSSSATPTATPTPIPQHEVYVANMGDHSILGFAMDQRGNVAATPTRVIRGPSTGLHNPFDVVTDSAERIYVGNLGDPPGTGSSVTVYSATASGDAQPVRTLGLFQSELRPSLEKPTSVAIRSRPETVLVADQPSQSRPGEGRIFEYSVTAGQDDPIRIIRADFTPDNRGDATTPLDPAAIGLDPQQRIHALETVRSRIVIFPGTLPEGIIEVAPDAMIEGPATGLTNPIDVALDGTGNIFVVNRGNLNPNVRDASITVYAAGAAGNAAPTRLIGGFGGPNANLSDPVGIAVDSGGRIFLLQGGSLKIFEAGANGDPRPMQTISGAITNPGGIWVR
jgi:hypothetical protein